MVADINLTVICALFVGVSFREASLVKKSIRILLSQTICQGVVFEVAEFLQSCRERSQKSITQTRFTCAIEFFSFLKQNVRGGCGEEKPRRLWLIAPHSKTSGYIGGGGGAPSWTWACQWLRWNRWWQWPKKAQAFFLDGWCLSLSLHHHDEIIRV